MAFTRKKKVVRKTTRKKVTRKTSASTRKKAGSKTTAKKKTTKKKAASKKKAVRKTASPTVSAEPGLIRLNKFLADHGVDSRRKCDELIEAGKVTIDGAPVLELGTRVDPTKQTVEVDGVPLKSERARLRYYLLNKPAGVVCTNEKRETRPRAIDMITDPKKGRIYTIGRLDEDSHGLILLTNDGDYANHVMHPRYGVKKTYLVKVRGKIDDEALQKVRNGVHLSEGKTAGARILVQRRSKDYSKLTVTLTEGMNREIRRSFARVGYKVVDLQRTRIGPLHLGGIKRAGRWRELTLMEARSVLDPEEQVDEEQIERRRNKAGESARRRGMVDAERLKERRKKKGGRRKNTRSGAWK